MRCTLSLAATLGLTVALVLAPGCGRDDDVTTESPSSGTRGAPTTLVPVTPPVPGVPPVSPPRPGGAAPAP